MLNNQHSVSVIIATRFRSHLIGGALDSLTKQSLKPDELIIVDNGPCSKTRKVADNFAQVLPIKYVEQPIKGVAHARNMGIKNSSGAYILFMDDDCFADKYWIENIVNSFKENPEVGCVGGELYPIMPKSPSLIDEFCCEMFAKSEHPIDLDSVR